MNFANILVLCTILATVKICSGYRVLGIYAFPGKSHYKVVNQVLLGLAQKGHQVDVISVLPNTEQHPNYKQIITLPDNSKKIMSFSNQFLAQSNFNCQMIGTIGNTICQGMNNSEFLHLAHNPPKDPPYDVIVTHLLNNHCFGILGHLWNIPVVVVSTTSLYPWMHDMVANPENLAFSPNNFLSIPREKSFWTRFWNVHYAYYIKFNYLYYTSEQTTLLKALFGPAAPSARELEQQISLVLVNSYFPINGAKPMTSAVIEVGGIHIQNEGPELSEELKKWLDDSDKGVIYFCLGSMFRIESFPRDVINIIFSTLARIKPFRVLIKIANIDDFPVELPENMYALPWLPQEKVLQHPNVKLFITHGGLLGTTEAIYYGVPMLCIPFLADQTTNTNNYVDKQIALSVDLEDITQESFDLIINEMLTNPMYKENVQRLSKVFKDRPMSPLDTAVFWTEFVVRNGKDSLRSDAMDLSWWQIALLDVYLVTFTGLFLYGYIILRIFILFFNLIRHKPATAVSKSKKRM